MVSTVFSIGWLKLADNKDLLPHPEQKIFGVGCVMTADTSLMSVDSSRHKNWIIFYHIKGIRFTGWHQTG
jgi:hypothetical protein